MRIKENSGIKVVLMKNLYITPHFSIYFHLPKTNPAPQKQKTQSHMLLQVINVLYRKESEMLSAATQRVVKANVFNWSIGSST